MENTLTITNKRIYDFYKKTGMDFENTNLIFVDILEKIHDASQNKSVSNALIEKINSLESGIKSFSDTISDMNKENFMFYGNKMSEFRKNYADDLKIIMASNNIDHIYPLIKETNANLIDKTSVLLNLMIPKSQECISKDLTIQFQQFNASISEKTNALLSCSLDKKTIDEFIHSIHQTVHNSQQTMTTLISLSESRMENRMRDTDKKINELKEMSSINHNSQQNLQNNVSEMLKKFEKGVGKGSISEHILYNILLGMYPCASELDKVSDEMKETGDIMFQSRSDRPRILIENKDHESVNVPKIDVDKFLRDCNKHNCCGILLSQHRGISNKEDFEIKINGKNVLLYVHKVKFDVDKIKLAIDVVEHFKSELDTLYINEDENNENYVVDASVMENINNEYIQFKNQKLTMLRLIKDFGDKMSSSLNDLKLPNLDNYLSVNFGSSSNQNDTICKYCDKHVPKSLMHHYRYCKSKIQIESNGQKPEVLENIVVEMVEPETIQPVITLHRPKIKMRQKQYKDNTMV